jgi:glyoxylase I family protein
MFMDHIVLNANDVELLIGFYTQVIGLRPDRLDLYHQGKAPFPSVRINDSTIIDIFPKSMWEEFSDLAVGRPNLHHFCIALSKDHWNNLQLRLAASSVAIFRGPEKVWGAHGDGISVFFHDPEGNTIEAKYYDEEK